MSTQTKIIDHQTGVEKTFGTMTEAGGWLKAYTGKKCAPGTLHNCEKARSLYLKRFEVVKVEKERLNAPPSEQEHRRHKDGWHFIQFPYSKDVICGEKKLKYYDRKKFDRIRDKLMSKGCVCFFDVTDAERERSRSRVEIYRKYDGMEFDDKVENMLQLAEQLDI